MKLICEPDCVAEENISNGNNGLTLISGILVLLMPKCALCWAAYMNFFSSLGLVTIPYRPWFLAVSIALFILTLMKLLYNAVNKKNFISFLLALLAGIIIMCQKLLQPLFGLNYLAIAMMGIAVTMDTNVKLGKKWFWRNKS